MNISTQTENKLFQLVPAKPGSTISTTVLSVGRYLVGRAESCDVIIPSNIVSSVHAVLEVTPTSVKIYDMNSRNGTYVNGNKSIAQDIKAGDMLAFGNIEFTLRIYTSTPDLPPVLSTLDPIGGNASIQKRELPKKSPVQLPPDDMDFDKEDDIPYIVYPLSRDPKSDFSEYIFEDADELYPIFKYELNKQSLEVIILHGDKVYSVDYLPATDATYQISGKLKGKKEIEFPYLAKDERVDFIEVHKGNYLIHKLHNYDLLHLTDNQVNEEKSDRVNLHDNDIVKLKNGDLEIYVRKVASPPKVKTPPFFRRDKDLRKYILLMLLIVILPVVALNFLEIEEELEDEKDPERIATILYQQKLTINTTRAIEKTKTEEKKAVKQKTDKPKTPKNTQEKKDPNQKNNEKKDTTKTAGDKQKQPVKKPDTKQAKGPTKPKKAGKPSKAQVQKAAKINNFKNTAANKRRANLPSTNTGKVDVYKSFDFKSSVSKLMAKGGTLKGVKTAKTGSATFTGTTAGVNGQNGKIQTATESGNGGKLTTTASTGSQVGTKGFSTKTGTYTAGIPSDTVVLGSMDPDVIRRILRQNIPRFRSCYQRELDRNASKDVSGIIRMVFTIGASGSVTRAGIDGNSGLPSTVKRCVVGVLRGISFPRPLGGGTVDVKQPFSFYPKRI